MKRISAEELLAQNPQVDPAQLEAAQQLADRLREAGFQGVRYRLATPLTGRRPAVRPPDKEKGRHAHLTRRH